MKSEGMMRMKTFTLKTPVVLLIFNRPDSTRVVFDTIRKVRPEKLFVIADGARPEKPGEEILCDRARKVIEEVDWDCQVFKNYADRNLRPLVRISSGLDWVYEHVEEAIILEDDCVPDLTFFDFCQILLAYYRHDTRIMSISGNNFQFGRRRTEYSYYFSRNTHCWGWATWRRAWKYYDIEMKLWPEIKSGEWLRDILQNRAEENFRKRLFEKVYNDKLYGWDYRWDLACWIQNGLTILPQVNLVSNIGFSKEATHTKNTKSPFSNMPSFSMEFPLSHPPFVIRDVQADNFAFQDMYGLLSRATRKAKSFILR